MSLRSGVSLPVCLVFIVAAGSARSADIDAGLRARVEAEASGAWQEYRQSTRFVQGVYREDVDAFGKKVRLETEWKANETCGLAKVTNLTDGSAEVFGQNSKYWFRLKTGKGGEWVVVDLFQGDDKSGDYGQDLDRRVRRHRDSTLGNFFWAAPNPFEKPLDETLRSPQAKLTAVKPASQGGGLVEVGFDVPPDSSGLSILVGGTLVLDPNRRWLPVRKTTRTKNRVGTGTQTTEYTYADDKSVTPLRAVERHEYNLTSEPKPWTGNWVREYDLRTPERLPDEREFTLSAFGLPEPAGVTWEKPTPRYVWFLVGAAVFGLLAIAIRCVAGRRARTETGAGI